MNGDSCLIIQPYTCMHTLRPHNTHAQKSPHNIALTHFLGSEPMSTSTSTHSSANESISWFHSFHRCQTPSISPLLHRPNTAAGGLKDREEKEGVWNILAVQRLLISHLLWSPRNVVFWWCVAVCVSVKWKKERGLKKDQEGTISSPRVYTRYLTFLLPLRDWCVSTVQSITMGRMKLAGGRFQPSATSSSSRDALFVCHEV